VLRAGHALFWILALVLVAVVLGTLPRMPAVVASHFGPSGAVNGWSSRAAYAWLVLGIGIPLPLGVIGLVYGATARGPQALNIPSRAYWLEPAHWMEAVRLVRGYMWWLGSLLTGTALAVHLVVLRANATEPPHLETRVIVLLLGSVVLAIGAWSVGWYRLLRPRPGG
jgi:uncharacterized membrane protein